MDPISFDTIPLSVKSRQIVIVGLQVAGRTQLCELSVNSLDLDVIRLEFRVLKSERVITIKECHPQFLELCAISSGDHDIVLIPQKSVTQAIERIRNYIHLSIKLEKVTSISLKWSGPVLVIGNDKSEMGLARRTVEAICGVLERNPEDGRVSVLDYTFEIASKGTKLIFQGTCGGRDFLEIPTKMWLQTTRRR